MTQDATARAEAIRERIGVATIRRCSSECWQTGDCDKSCDESPSVLANAAAYDALDGLVAELDRVTRERDEARLERDAAGFFAKHQTEDEYFLALRSAEAELAAVRERCQQLYDALEATASEAAALLGPKAASIVSRARAVLAEGRTA